MQLMINLPDNFLDQALSESVAKLMKSNVFDDSFPTVMNKGTAAKFLGCTRNTLDKMIKDEHLPCARIDGKFFITKMDLLSWLDTHKVND